MPSMISIGSLRGLGSWFITNIGPWFQEYKLQSSDINNGWEFGTSVSISNDGATAIIGAPFAQGISTSNSGAAYIFTRSGTTWSQQAKIAANDGSASDYFGNGISLSGDGNTAIVLASGYSTTGKAYIFTRSGTTWTQNATTVTSAASVSISNDGNTFAVGSIAGTNETVTIYTKSGTTWSLQSTLQASDRASFDNFGISVSLSNDGNIIVVGAGAQDSGGTQAGAAYIFTRSGTTWSQQAKIVASDAQANDWFGARVWISGDGNTALIGATYPGATSTSYTTGKAYVFTRSGTTWSQQSKLLSSDIQTQDRFGISVSLSNDGNIAVIGASDEDTGGVGAGAVYVFNRSGTSWAQEMKIMSRDIVAGDYFGFSSVISNDGKIILIGAPIAGTASRGAAYVFTKN